MSLLADCTTTGSGAAHGFTFTLGRSCSARFSGRELALSSRRRRRGGLRRYRRRRRTQACRPPSRRSFAAPPRRVPSGRDGHAAAGGGQQQAAATRVRQDHGYKAHGPASSAERRGSVAGQKSPSAPSAFFISSAVKLDCPQSVVGGRKMTTASPHAHGVHFGRTDVQNAGMGVGILMMVVGVLAFIPGITTAVQRTDVPWDLIPTPCSLACSRCPCC